MRDFEVFMRGGSGVEKSRQKFEELALTRNLGRSTPEEALVIYHYTTDKNGVKLNEQLRAGTLDAHHAVFARLLDRALNSRPVLAGEVYRRIMIAPSEFGTFVQRYLNEQPEDAFMSASS